MIPRFHINIFQYITVKLTIFLKILSSWNGGGSNQFIACSYNNRHNFFIYRTIGLIKFLIIKSICLINSIDYRLLVVELCWEGGGVSPHFFLHSEGTLLSNSESNEGM